MSMTDRPPVLDSAVEKWTIDIYYCNSMEAISGRLTRGIEELEELGRDLS